MKALDTSVLVALLEGDRSAKDLVRKLRGNELATTEMNMVELAILASRAPSRSRARRRDALDRLRQRLTVLPIDTRAAAEAQRRILKGGAPQNAVLAAMLGSLDAAGCEELVTTDPAEITGGWRFRVSKFSRRTSK